MATNDITTTGIPSTTNPTSDDPTLYPYNLGPFTRPITTPSPSAQTWFNNGLTWTYAFHHEESARCFLSGLTHDPTAPMLYWGLAYTLGPNYNKPWDMFDDADLSRTLNRIRAAITAAKDYSANATEVERALIDAIQPRVPETLDEESYRACNEAYAAAMADVYARFPGDLDVAALYADALMNMSAWDLWDLRTGKPTPGARSEEAKAVLEAAFEGDREGAMGHPGLLHLYVHLMEMSRTPEAAVEAGNALRGLCPDAGHLVHMPSHLDILVGDYKAAVKANADAIVADEKFVARHGGSNFYTFYRLHDYHSLIYAAMFAGKYGVCMEYVEGMEKSVPEELLRIESPPMADWSESWVSVRVHVLVRFGKWEELLKLEFPEDKELYSVTTAMYHYGKGVAYAATGRVDEAQKERDLLYEAVPRVQPSRIAGDFPNKAVVVLEVAKAMLDGELEYRRGNYSDAFRHLETAIERDDGLVYAEPWPWMQPVRHAYGALLLEQGRVEEAESAFKADLGFDDTLPRARQHPNNVWALHGYLECLEKTGKEEEAGKIREQLEAAQLEADEPVKASCFCRTVSN
ncbi:hypothetical protein BU24DRAFT_132550 [Aaosphaeria arxii CBS 175.79]|uniref:TPR domain protein n=1 Tax=Aaosphaeria arxii CBS 175.79 TaxID=1450172 RepID=A0A6A5Y4S7_9PLEO|nr:uncharacterized protein BU24DRAFT_132550 [Aaosphaeria arxii CBS 175.79]KAF2020037.1 hypothetical protein BU24DRAFT_132550 [Aaosphaeria arxii CBS 175.79]